MNVYDFLELPTGLPLQKPFFLLSDIINLIQKSQSTLRPNLIPNGAIRLFKFFNRNPVTCAQLTKNVN
jgi:hypothetical protein